jgi:uncharacterized protein YecA (UPF0149 family)
MSEKLILQKFYQMPENLRQEVVDFMEYLIMKYKVAEKTPAKVAKFGSAKEKQLNTTDERIFGRAKGRYKISPDFDAPLDDFKDYM